MQFIKSSAVEWAVVLQPGFSFSVRVNGKRADSGQGSCRFSAGSIEMNYVSAVGFSPSLFIGEAAAEDTYKTRHVLTVSPAGQS